MEKKETVPPAENGDTNVPHTKMDKEYNERTNNKETDLDLNEEDGVRGSKTSGKGNHGSHYPRQGD
jgi:hypothetical protein